MSGSGPRSLAACTLALALAVVAAAARAETPAAPGAHPERAFRGPPRLVRTDVQTYAARSAGRARIGSVRLWGVEAASADGVSQLHVVTQPPHLRGTALILHTGGDAGDAAWLFLRSSGRYRRIRSRGVRVVLPGTAVSLDDLRGPYAAGRQSPRLAETPESADGRPVRTYAIEAYAMLGDVWLPERARIEDRSRGITSEIRRRYWPLPQPVPAEFFAPHAAPGTPLARIEAARRSAGAAPAPR